MLFTATELGNNTSGTFEIYFDGSDVELTENGEDVDSVTRLEDGRLLISTSGTATAGTLNSGDEDILVFTPTNTGSLTTGTWDIYFDGSDLGFDETGKDIIGVTIDEFGDLYLSTINNFSVQSAVGEDEDVLKFTPTSLGENTQGIINTPLFFDGSTYTLGDNEIRDLDLQFTALDNNQSVEINIAGTNNAIEGMAYDTNSFSQNNINISLGEDLLNLGIEAVFDNLVGFYEILDINGAIDTNGDGINDLTPGDTGYAKAAIVNRIDNWELRAGSSGEPSKNTTTEQFGNVIITGGKMYAPFVIANAGEIGFDGFVSAEDGETDGEFNEAATNIDDMVAYFSFIGANPDDVVHLQARGNNTFGFEDLPSNLGVSDNDFDDAIFKFDFSS